MTVAVVTTGGTIASVEHDDGARPSLTGEELVANVSDVDVDIDVVEFAALPSPHFTIDTMYELTSLLNEISTEDGIEGIVVTHGTDALEETAFFTDLCYEGKVPIAFTGAMRHHSETSPDGPANLAAAIETVVSDGADVGGVVVVFNDRVFSAREVSKFHTTVPDAFRAPEFGPLAIIEKGTVTWRRAFPRVTSPSAPDPSALSPDVHAIAMVADAPIEQIQAAATSSALCIAAMGGGSVPPNTLEPLRSLREEGVPIIVTTRCPTGRVFEGVYSTRESMTSLKEMGAYVSDVDLAKTRIKAIVALAGAGLERAFDR